ncbi:hypothetical protein J0895_06420, partial [Phormidium pseudopriestleyi FRX01]
QCPSDLGFGLRLCKNPRVFRHRECQRDTVIPQLIPRTVAEEEWADRFDAIVRRFEVLQRGILSPPSQDNT